MPSFVGWAKSSRPTGKSDPFVFARMVRERAGDLMRFWRDGGLYLVGREDLAHPTLASKHGGARGLGPPRWGFWFFGGTRTQGCATFVSLTSLHPGLP
jgi:hypothetical protein